MTLLTRVRRWAERVLGGLRLRLRQLRVVFDDLRSDSHIAFGGPMDGKRLKNSVPFRDGRVDIEMWCYSATGELTCIYTPTYCEGVYVPFRGRWLWEQWSRVAVPPSDSEAQ